MQIDLEQTMCFLEVARLLSFTKAAEVLYLSQPVVSRKVATLEAQMDVKLIKRGAKGIQLTEAGEEFRELFQEYNARIFALQQKYSELAMGKITFGIFHGCNIMDSMGNFIANFQKANPKIDFWGSSGNLSALLSGLQTRQFDFIIGLRETFVDVDDLIVEDICKTHFAVVFSKYNPLAQKSNLCFKDFASQTYYASIDGKICVDSMVNIKKLFKKHGFLPNTRLLNGIDSIIMALNMGTGYILLYEQDRIINHTDFGHLLLTETMTLSLAYTKQLDKSSVKYAFIQKLLQELRSKA